MTETMLGILTVVFASAGISLAVYAVLYNPEKAAAKRAVQKLYASRDLDDVFEKAAQERKEKTKLSDRIKVSEKFKSQYEAADMPISANEFVLLWAGTTLLPLLAMLLIFHNPIMAVGAGGIGFAIPLLYFKKSQHDRYEKFVVQLGDALITMTNSLKSGFSFQQAMRSICSDMDDPIASEFKKVLTEVDYGTSLNDAMIHMYQRVPSDDLKMLIAALAISGRTGGSLADVLQVISNTVKERIRIRQDVKAMSAQGHISSLIVGLMPLFIALALMVMNPDYINRMFSDPRGRKMLIAAVAMEAIGFKIMQKITDISL